MTDSKVFGVGFAVYLSSSLFLNNFFGDHSSPASLVIPTTTSPTNTCSRTCCVLNQTKKTHRGKCNLRTAERLTEKWVESGELDHVLMKIHSNTRKPYSFGFCLFSCCTYYRNHENPTVSRSIPPGPRSGASHGHSGKRFPQPHTRPTET